MSDTSEYLTIEELNMLKLAKCGKNVLISKFAKIVHPEKLKIGNNVRIDNYCVLIGDISIGDYVHIAAFSLISGHCGIEIEAFCSISARVTLYSVIDDYSGEFLVNPTLPRQYRSELSGRICLQKHVALGIGATIFPRVTIGEGAVVGAHSLVVLPLKEWGVYFGSPVQLIKFRKKNLLQLEKKLWRED